MHGYYSFLYDYFIFFPLLSLVLSDSLSPTLQCQVKEEEEEADRQHPSTITTNQPPPPQPTHYNINLIKTQSTQN